MTAWTPIPTDAVFDGRYAYYVAPDSDDEYAVDLSAHLAADEEVTSPEVVVYLLGADGSPASDVSDTVLVGNPSVDGAVVSQRINSLDAGRVYRAWVYHGAAGNRRGASFVISVMEGVSA